MADAVGLSIGATRFAGAQAGGAAATRQSVLTLYHERPSELGVPGENPNLTQPGLVVTGFVERVGDSVGLVAADGSMHRGERLVADALREMLYTVTGGRPPAEQPMVTYPAHWPRSAVDALRSALGSIPEWNRGGEPINLVSDAAATISALQSEAGVPIRGVIALCDFGGTGTSVTLLDAGHGFAPLGPTLRYTDFSGDLIDQALLTHVMADVAPVAAVDTTGTAALGPLHRLRGRCKGAKERLSSATVTTLTAQMPGFSGDVRLTRSELDDVIRAPLAEFVAALANAMQRNDIHQADLVAVASTGGGARIPIVTTTLSEHFRVPVITTPRPELAAANGAALRAAWGPDDDRSTAMAPVAAAAATMAAPAFADADAQSSSSRALAWSEAHDVPPVAPPVESLYDPDPDPAFAPTGLSSARPQLEFTTADTPLATEPPPWYRRTSTLVGVAASVVLLLSASAVVAFGSDTAPASNTTPATPSTTAQAPDASPAPAPAQGAAQSQPQDPQRTGNVEPPTATQYQAPVQQQVDAPPPQQPAPAPDAPTPSADAPPPPTQEPTTVTETTQPPTFTTTVTASPTQTVQPPASQPPSNTQSPPTLTIPRLLPPLFNPPHN